MFAHMNNLIGSQEAADILGIDRATLSRWITTGKLTAHKLGTGKTSAYLIERSEIERIKAGDAA